MLQKAEDQEQQVAFGKVECILQRGRHRMVNIIVDLYTPAGEGIEIAVPHEYQNNMRLCPGRVARADQGRTDMSRQVT